jgi:hypothetical protein
MGKLEDMALLVAVVEAAGFQPPVAVWDSRGHHDRQAKGD